MMWKRLVEAIIFGVKYVVNGDSGWMLVHKEIRRWHRVDTYAVDREIEKMKVHFHLYENINGMRRVRVHHTDEIMRKNSSHLRDSYYIGTVLPWLDGQTISGIDSHGQAKQQQMMDHLAGQ